MKAFRRALRVFAKPVRSGRGGSGPAVQAYRGFGTRHEVFLIGRVLRRPRLGSGTRRHGLQRDVIDVFRRFFSHGLARATVEADLGGATLRATSDQDGYFRIRMRVARPLPDDAIWHGVRLRLVQPRASHHAETEAMVFVPPREARYAVVSDIDDTVVYTGVANKLGMMWRLFFTGAGSRVAFPGVAALYAGLHDGAAGHERNPLLYVSRAPWGLYEVLSAFFNHHRIPVGPLLFLRDWGLRPQSPLPRRARSHKPDLIRTMLSVYGDLPFILIGDSGQRDPELYARLVHENPGRVLAVYIRNVTRDARRDRAIDALAQEVVAAGSSLVLAADSFAMAEHAARHGWISPVALAAVLAATRRDEAAGGERPADGLANVTVEARDARPPAAPRRRNEPCI